MSSSEDHLGASVRGGAGVRGLAGTPSASWDPLVEESSWSAAGHKLVRQFLDEKQEEHEALCQLFRAPNNALRRHFLSTYDKVVLNGVYLDAAIALVSYQEGFVTSAHYQGQQGSVVSAAIVAKLKLHLTIVSCSSDWVDMAALGCRA